MTIRFRNYTHFKKRSISELTIPGEALKDILESTTPPHRRFIAKLPKKCGNQEILTEYLINSIGMEVPGLGISRSAIGLVPNNDNVLQLRFLSLYFVGEGERLTHGIQLFGKYYSEEEIDQFEKGQKARQLYTIENIQAALELTYPEHWNDLFLRFVEMCAFDAWIGNQDRHAKNWGILEPVHLGSQGLRFAPIFDTARGLFWDFDDIRLKRFLENPEALEGYIRRSRPQFSFLGNPRINHVDLIAEISLRYAFTKRCLAQMLNEFRRVNISAVLNRPAFASFSRLRIHLIRRCLDLRLAALESVLK